MAEWETDQAIEAAARRQEAEQKAEEARKRAALEANKNQEPSK